jgi:hypothetical protein
MVIFEDTEVEVLHHKGTTSFLLITFGDMLSVVNGSDFYASSACHKKDISAIGIMPKRRHWYPPQSMHRAIHEINEVTSATRLPIILYGGSMGGYGALKYSSKLHADAVLALCPQWSICPQEVGSRDLRFQRFYESDNGLSIRVSDVAGRLYVAYDRAHQQDAFHAEKIGKLPGFVGITMPHVGHNMAPVLKGSDNLIAMLDAALDDNVPVFRRVTATARRASAVRVASVIAKAIPKRPEAFRILERLCARQPDKVTSDLYLAVGQNLALAGHDDTAKMMLDRAISANATSIGTMLEYSKLCTKQHDYNNAVIWAERALRGAPGNRFLLETLATARARATPWSDKTAPS